MSYFDAVPLVITDLMSQHAKNFPNREAVIFESQRYSWKELNERINVVANALIKKGVKKGDKVSVFMSNMPQSIEIMFGVIKAGGVLVPLATMIEPDTLLHMIKNSDSKIVFFSSDNIESINYVKENHQVETVEVGKKGSGSYEQFIANVSAEEPNIELKFEDDCIILYSSGTTGVPKGILHTHYSRYMFATRLAISNGFTQEAITLLTTPLYTNSTWAPMLPTLAVGGTIIVMKKFSPGRFLEISQKERPTHSVMVPTQYYMVLNHPDFDQFDVSSFKQLISVASPLHKQTKLEILTKFNCKFAELYGLTEGPGTMLFPDNVLEKPDSVGKPYFGTDIRIIDEEGKELPKGEAGEIVGRGSVLMKGYYKLPEKTQEVIWYDENGRKYLRTGDMGKLDEDGFLYILGRKKDMIISGGLNIYAADIENVLSTHSDVADCAVIAVPHEKWGETPLALVELKENAAVTGPELKSWVNERVNKFQRVADVEIVQAFPRNHLGKILKRELRENRSQMIKQ
ncbi:class I adenylate-forming enzyme family protein [Bacillus dakarensis]|uniref:class I adenylate-forming enzyme family protein n=1 Tax=Robertmurraya dakarensis TaxID=1926278 RepID=UPI000980BF53|nr:AMP-binding protein [Bacillus dakarensis]